MSTLAKVSALLLEAATIVAKLQAQPEQRAKRKPKPNAVERFVAEQCFTIDGVITEFCEFKKAFASWLPPEDLGKWSNAKIVAALPVAVAYGRHTGNKSCIGNLSLVNVAPASGKPWHVKNGRLTQKP